MLVYLRTNGFKIFVVLILLTAFSPGVYPHAFYQSLIKAQHTLNYGQTSLALDLLEDAIKFEPAALSLSETALRLSLEAEEWERAETHRRALIQLGITGGILACADLQLALARDRPTLESSIELDGCPSLQPFLEQWAIEQFQSGQFTTAVPLIETLLANEVDSQQMRRSLAFYLAAVDPQEAVEPLRQIQSSQGQLDRLALDLLLAIQDSQVSDSPAYLSAQLGQIFARAEQWALAREAFQRAVSLEPEYAQAWGYLGVARDHAGEDGAADLQKAVDLAPEDPILLTLHAVHYNQRNDPETALKILERAARLDPNNPAIAVELGRAFTNIGDLESAQQSYLQATRLAPDEASFWQLLAEFSLRNEANVENLALPAARNALILKPSSSQAWVSLGYAHYLMENFSLAERALLMAAELSPTDPRVQYHLGLLFSAQGESHKAMAAWTIAVRLAPTDLYAQLSQRAIQNLILNP